MGAYLSLREIRPDLILSAGSLRAQRTADSLASSLEYQGKIHYLKELYRADPQTVLDLIAMQDDEIETIFLILHNPEISEVANILGRDHFGKIPALGIVALDFPAESWSAVTEKTEGETDFFIFPKQFRYFMPRQIRAVLGHP